ncbi:acyltransferase [Granulicella sp. dw_53]|uniref:acyltransferase family protein n=1 Tax=Granulicella sp. dw_53 TaxID=2719792 RepID=UPI001BD50D40|nr:acyltransferase [Granulicella sp. dw_53]
MAASQSILAEERSSVSLPLDEPQGSGYERHIFELDGIRGIAALAVVFCHVAQHVVMYSTGLLHAVLNVCVFGFLGVDVFFALSGFLITGILLKKRDRKHYYRNFYARRILRLAPCYLLIIALVWMFVPFSGPFLLLSLVYAANFAPLFHIPYAYGVLWSLSVEEHFYLIWPWVVRFVRPRGIAMVCVGVCFLTPALRIYEAYRGTLTFYFSWDRFDGMAWGGLLAVALYSGWITRERQKKLPLALLLSALFLFASALLYVRSRGMGGALLYSASPIFSVVVIAMAVTAHRKMFSILRSPLLRFFGDISYWVYLSHFLALNLTMDLLKSRLPQAVQHGGFPLWVVVFSATLIPSVITGVAVRRWIELPALRLKNRFA